MDLLISTAAGGVAGLLAALTKSYFDSRAKVDEQLHTTRTQLYEELWRKTSLLPKWPRNDGLTAKELDDLSRWLRDWYFGVEGRARKATGASGASGAAHRSRVPGGLYLSTRSRKRYEVVQVALRDVAGPDTATVPVPDYDRVRDALSRLRTQMTEDLLSRRGAPFRLT